MVLEPHGDDKHQSNEPSESPVQVSPESYDVWRQSQLGTITEARELDLIFQLAGPLQGCRLLDAGCRDGIYLVEAARRGAQATGLDLSEAMLRVARRRAADAGVPIQLERGDVRALPFPDHSFDIVIAATALRFVTNPEGAVGEMARVLTPGGRLVIGELGRWNTWAAWRRLRGSLGSESWRQATFRSRRQIIDLVDGSGLNVDQVGGAIYYPPLSFAAHGGDVFGNGVNIASRIQGVVGAGEIGISEVVYENIKNTTTISATLLGDTELKSVETPVTLYTIVSGATSKPA